LLIAINHLAKKGSKKYFYQNLSGILNRHNPIEFRERPGEINERDLTLTRTFTDLKSYVKSIRGLAQLGMKDENLSNRVNYFHMIQETSLNLEEALNELLKIGVRKREKVHFTKMKLARFLDELKSELEDKSEFDAINIRMDVDVDIEVYSDRSLLRTVFQSILENAVKFRDMSKKISFVRITAMKQSELVSVTISDNGIGIVEDHIPRIFDLFYRIQPAESGKGLGLYIVKETLKCLHSGIKVHSEKGRGSIFILEIPTTKDSYLIRNSAIQNEMRQIEN